MNSDNVNTEIKFVKNLLYVAKSAGDEDRELMRCLGYKMFSDWQNEFKKALPYDENAVKVEKKLEL